MENFLEVQYAVRYKSMSEIRIEDSTYFQN